MDFALNPLGKHWRARHPGVSSNGVSRSPAAKCQLDGLTGGGGEAQTGTTVTPQMQTPLAHADDWADRWGAAQSSVGPRYVRVSCVLHVQWRCRRLEVWPEAVIWDHQLVDVVETMGLKG